ncbi:hypothetical protein X798_07907, partial [Onchocerca flexuosa]
STCLNPNKAYGISRRIIFRGGFDRTKETYSRRNQRDRSHNTILCLSADSCGIASYRTRTHIQPYSVNASMHATHAHMDGEGKCKMHEMSSWTRKCVTGMGIGDMSLPPPTRMSYVWTDEYGMVYALLESFFIENEDPVVRIP